MKQLAPHLIVEVIRDAPQSEGEVADPDWWGQSTVGQLLKRGEQMELAPHVRHDFEQVKLYFTRTFPRLAEKTRSIIEASLMGVLDPFCRGLLYRLFCNQTTVVPEDTLEGKIIVVNQPLKRDLTIGLLAQTIWKVLFQGRMEQRQEGETRPTFLVLDEAHLLLSLKDMQFFSTARSSKVATLWMTQNLPNVLVAMGESEGGNAKAESILSLAQTKIFCQNSCPVTNQWASDLIGRKRIWLNNSNVSSPRQNHWEFLQMEDEQVSTGSSETFEYTLQPNEFTRLRKGGKHGFCEAIVFQGGRNWYGSNENFAKVSFSQGF
jgi:type IV secretory pathway TraG/TraD family ATPase VirD4